MHLLRRRRTLFFLTFVLLPAVLGIGLVGRHLYRNAVRAAIVNRITAMGGKVVWETRSESAGLWERFTSHLRADAIRELRLPNDLKSCMAPHELAYFGEVSCLDIHCEGSRRDYPYFVEISKMKNLFSLGLYNVDPAYAAPLASLTRLEHLGVDVKDGGDPKHFGMLARIPNLWTFSITTTRAADSDFEFLSSLHSLIHVGIFNRQGVTGRAIRYLAPISTLRNASFVFLEADPHDMTVISSLQSIEEVELDRCPVDDRIIPALKKLPHLKNVTLRAANLTEKSIPELLDWEGVVVGVPECEGISEEDWARVFEKTRSDYERKKAS